MYVVGHLLVTFARRSGDFGNMYVVGHLLVTFAYYIEYVFVQHECHIIQIGGIDRIDLIELLVVFVYI